MKGILTKKSILYTLIFSLIIFISFSLYYTERVKANGGPVNIDDASNFGILPQVPRQVVRTSSGTLYTALNQSGSCEIWKSADGSSWSEVDSSNNPVCTASSRVALAIDSTNALHMIYHSANTTLRWIKITSDTFGSSENVETPFANHLSAIGIAIDSNDVPHVVYNYDEGGASLVYKNRVGGTWNSLVTISASPYSLADITIDSNNIPEVIYHTNGGALVAVLGNVNNASSFSSQTIDATVSTGNGVFGSSIGVDTSGNTWVAYVDVTTSYITLLKHNSGDAWDTWQSSVTNSVAGSEPSLAINGTDVYIFYQDGGNDIAYDKYDGSWLGSTVLQTGTFQDVRPKWSYLYNNQGSTQIDYLYSDATDVYWASLTLSGGGGGGSTSRSVINRGNLQIRKGATIIIR